MMIHAPRVGRTLTALMIAVGLSACNVEKDAFIGPVTGNDEPIFTNVSSALTASCGTCHGAASGRNFLVTMDSATLVSSGFISPASPATSLLLVKSRGGAGHGGGNVATFTARDSALVYSWVDGLGATIIPAAVSVAVAYDASHVAFRFTWKSQPKQFPVGRASFGQVFSSSYHDILKFDGTIFNTLAAGSRMDEDRVSFMVQRAGGSVAGFGASGCYVACHTVGAGRTHKLLAADTLDHWHWRGGRSGPMGYAEDASVDQVGRIRDAIGTPYPKWIRSAGDRIREDQAALAATGIATANGLPRFVFNQGKLMPGGYIIPRFFLSTVAGLVMSDPYTQIPAVQDLSVNRSLLVAYQDLTFDAVNKVNALDVAYLTHVVNDGVAQLPTHLRDTLSVAFGQWRTYWAAQSGIAVTDSAAASAKLAAIVAEWEGSTRNAMVTRSIGFIYPSDQHDITSTSSFDVATGTVTVTLFRALFSAAGTDSDLSGLPSGLSYVIGFAMHDVGGGSETHDISLPYIVGTSPVTDIRATQVSNVRSADWGAVPAFRTNWVATANKRPLDFLLGASHPGSAGVNAQRCQDCHTAGGSGRILNP